MATVECHGHERLVARHRHGGERTAAREAREVERGEERLQQPGPMRARGQLEERLRRRRKHRRLRGGERADRDSARRAGGVLRMYI
eukprot:5817595-Prymnesium_polylepis.1